METPRPSERPTQPIDQWWTINGEGLLAALTQAHQGDQPDLVYLELLANSECERPGEDD